MKLFINTGGKGERLYPLTKDIPKPLVNICGKPVLQHLIDWAQLYGIREVIFMNGHLAEKIIEYFKDGSEFGLKIFHSTESYPLGSGGALKYARKFVTERFTYISGDILCQIDLKKMELFHEKNNSDITAFVHKSSHPKDSDILQIDENGKVIKFVSKHEDHTNAGELSNSGLCIIEPEILNLMEKNIFNFENYLFPRILENNKRFFAYYSEEFISDMGTFKRLKKCEEYLRSKQLF
jgi:NDP-sugar pyrophosphorylase family protein